MEVAIRPSKISRVDRRYHHLAQDVVPRRETVQQQEATSEEDEEEEEVVRDAEEPLLLREQKPRRVMGRAHRMFHRRQAQPSNTLTVAVEVVATINDQGMIIAQETRTLTATPGIPTIQQLPSVPPVPPFPSDLAVPSVPAFPFPSGVPTAQPLSVTPQDYLSSPPPTSTILSDFTSILTPGILSSGYNSTTSSTTSSTRSFSTSRTLSTSSRSSSSASSTSSSSRTSTLSSSSTSTSTSSSSSSSFSSASSTSAQATSSSHAEVGGGQGPALTAPPPAAATSSIPEAAADTDNGGIGTPKVVGSVIGSLAGAALLLFLLLFLIKRHKRKGALQFSGADNADNQPITTSGEQMATRGSFATPSFLNRFSMASRSTAETSTTGERGFQRISGRKLPSAFSEGMTSEQFARGEGTLSGSSFYRDEKGFYGGPGPATSKEFGKETGGPSNYGTVGTKERIMPSPARTPIIHHPDDAPPFGASRNGGSTLSPPHSPNPDLPPRGTLGRSHPSHDGSRSSRFTENV